MSILQEFCHLKQLSLQMNMELHILAQVNNYNFYPSSEKHYTWLATIAILAITSAMVINEPIRAGYKNKGFFCSVVGEIQISNTVKRVVWKQWKPKIHTAVTVIRGINIRSESLIKMILLTTMAAKIQRELILIFWNIFIDLVYIQEWVIHANTLELLSSVMTCASDESATIRIILK